MVQQGGRRGGFVGPESLSNGRHLRPLTMSKGIVASAAAVPFTLSAEDKIHLR